MHTKAFLLATALAVYLTRGSDAHSADEPTTQSPPEVTANGAKPEQHIMMDHSPGDAKAMSAMKDKTVKVNTAGDPPSARETEPGTEY